MKRAIIFLAAHLTLVGRLACAATDPTFQVDAFVTSTMDVSGLEQLQRRQLGGNVNIHIIDGIANVKVTLNLNLPPSYAVAKRIALARLQELQEADRAQLRASAEALLLARQLGVARYPAVVFDRQWAVYGVTDLSQAYAVFQQHVAREQR